MAFPLLPWQLFYAVARSSSLFAELSMLFQIELTSALHGRTEILQCLLWNSQSISQFNRTVCSVRWAARLLGASSGIRKAVRGVQFIFFQRFGRKEGIGKLTEECRYESCLKRYGRKESETRAGSSRKVVCVQRQSRQKKQPWFVYLGNWNCHIFSCLQGVCLPWLTVNLMNRQKELD